jgi:hypothetical protein
MKANVPWFLAIEEKCLGSFPVVRAEFFPRVALSENIFR